MSLYFYPPPLCHMSNLRNSHIVLSILGVNGHIGAPTGEYEWGHPD